MNFISTIYTIQQVKLNEQLIHKLYWFAQAAIKK